VAELDKQGIELNIDDFKHLVFKLIKNIDKFTDVVTTFESAHDLLKDLGPVAREVIIDFIKKLHELEQKGYFEFFKAAGNIFDNIITHYSTEDLRLLADNIVTILDTIKNLTQPEMLDAMNNAVFVFQKLDIENIPEYSMLKAMKEMRTPEMKKGIGFMITFLKNLSGDKAISEKSISN